MLSAGEIIELERKVFKYRLKQRLHYVIYLILILLSMGAGVYFHYNPINASLKITLSDNNISANTKTLDANVSPTQISEDNHLHVKETTNNTVAITHNIPPSEEIKNNSEESKTDDTLILHLPSLKPQNSEKKHLNTHTIPKEEELDNKVLIRKKSLSPEENFYRSIEETISTGDIMAPPPLSDEKPKGFIKIETQEVNSIQYLKEKFEKTHNIIFALMLSEEYYLTKSYEQSNKWALIANGIDSENEKSWIWFAKSKIKLGKKEDAIVALQAYLKNHKSSAIQSILNQIALGEVND